MGFFFFYLHFFQDLDLVLHLAQWSWSWDRSFAYMFSFLSRFFSLVFFPEVWVCDCLVLNEVTVRIILLFSLEDMSCLSSDFVGFSYAFGILNLFFIWVNIIIILLIFCLLVNLSVFCVVWSDGGVTVNYPHVLQDWFTFELGLAVESVMICSNDFSLSVHGLMMLILGVFHVFG